MSVAFTDLLFALSGEPADNCPCSQKAWLAQDKLLSPLPGCRAHLYSMSHPCFSHQGSSSVTRCCIFSEWARKESYKYNHTASFPNTGFTDSLVTICEIWSVQSSRKVWVYTTLCCLKCSFLFLFSFMFCFVLNTFCFLLQSKERPGLEVWKKQHRNGELTKNQSREFSISAGLHTGIW